MILGMGACCASCETAPRSRGLGWGWSDLYNPFDLANDVVSSAGGVAMNVVTQVDSVTKKTLETAIAGGQAVRQISSPQSGGGELPTVSYLPLALGGVAAAGLLLWAVSGRKKKEA